MTSIHTALVVHYYMNRAQPTIDDIYCAEPYRTDTGKIFSVSRRGRSLSLRIQVQAVSQAKDQCQLTRRNTAQSLGSRQPTAIAKKD